MNKSSMLTPEPSLPKRKLRVLSLFDGLGTGLVALDKLNICVENYYSSEIDQDAMNIVRMHYGDRVTTLGDIRNLDESKLEEIYPIDLVLGGSPCEDLSLVNPARKGLYDPEGTGILFFEFYRILCTLKAKNGQPFFWVFENVATMPLQYREIITRFLECDSTMIDAVWLSPQHRPRMFWGNLLSFNVQAPQCDGPSLQQYLMPGRTATVEKLRTVTTRNNSLRQGPDMTYPVKNSNKSDDILWITELEEVFGFPRHYTDTGNISKTRRQQLIGKAWSVPVITHLLSFLSEYYSTK